MQSENGWPIIDSSVLNRQPIPGTNIVPVPGTLGGDVGWLLRWVGQQFDKRVMKLYNPGCWGWNAPTAVPGTSVYSNHSSGTAVDFNAPTFPWKTRNMSAAQRQSCREIVAQTDYIVVWGGDFTTLVDEMHFEINGTPEDVARIVEKLKGGEEMVNEQDVINIYNSTAGVEPSKQEVKNYVNSGKSYREIHNEVYLWAIKNKKDYLAYKSETKVGTAPADAKPLEPGLYKVK